MKKINPETWRNYKFAGEEDGKNCTIYYLSDSDGSGKGIMHVYEVMTGILMSYDVLDMKSCWQDTLPVPGFIQINYCNEGCFEFELETGEIGFLSSGDLAISDTNGSQFVSSHIPYGKYRGISIMIDIEKAQPVIDKRIPEAGIDLKRISERLFSNSPTFFIRAKPALEHIFSELYHVNEEIRKPYMVLKTLELLCFINASGYECQERLPSFSHAVAEAVKEVYAYINHHFIDEITVGELALKFCISETNLSSCFKRLYGQPAGAYIRAKKLRYAAELLSGRTEMSVGDVAHLVGYGNQSKFASAFRAVYGYSPLEYRRRMKNNASEQKKRFSE